MKRILVRLWGLALLVAPPLCAADLPRAGSQADVRYRFGIPSAIRFDASGAQVWEYSDWRNGRAGFEVRFDGAGSVAASRSLRTDADVNRVVAERLTAPEALERLGEPHVIRLQGTSVTWSYRQPAGRTLTVSFGPDGRVSDAKTTR